MRVFRLIENKLIYLVLANVGSKKNFSLQGHNRSIPQISLISTAIFTKREINALLFHFCFFLSEEKQS